MQVRRAARQCAPQNRLTGGGCVSCAQRQPVASWRYKAEGNSNIVFTYEGTTPELRGAAIRVVKVLRRPKQPPAAITGQAGAVASSNGSTPPPGAAGAGALAPGLPEKLQALERELLPRDGVEFTRECVAPLLGRRWLCPAVDVPVSVSTLMALDSVLAAKQDRPTRRAGVAVDASRRMVTVVVDHTVLRPPRELAAMPAPWRRAARAPSVLDSFCVEVKPKCGFLPTAPGLRRADKYKYCRFCMHQCLKLQAGKVSHLSSYCPIDLYSGARHRVLRALKALTETPQNNFRVFRNGTPRFGDDARGLECRGGADHRALLDAALAASPFDHLGDGGEARAVRPCDGLCALLALILEREPVLGALRRVQQLDTLDIEGVWALWRELCDDAAAPIDGAARSVLRNFLLAATVKDCSVMVGFRLVDAECADGAVRAVQADRSRWQPRAASGERGGGARPSEPAAVGSIPLSSVRRACGLHEADEVAEAAAFVYTVSVVDTDPKPLSRVPRYERLDAEVVAAFAKSERRRDVTPCVDKA